MSRNYAQDELDRQYHAEMRRNRRPQHSAAFDWAALAGLFALLALLAVIVLYQRGYLLNPTQPDYSPDVPRPAQPAAPVYAPAPLPTIAPEQRAVIEAQQPHAIRNAEPTPAPAVEQPAEFVAPVELAPAQAIPTIAPEQAQVIGARQSNGCAPGEVFVPRSGCHAPGSAGAMPGPVGAP